MPWIGAEHRVLGNSAFDPVSDLHLAPSRRTTATAYLSLALQTKGILSTATMRTMLINTTLR